MFKLFYPTLSNACQFQSTPRLIRFIQITELVVAVATRLMAVPPGVEFRLPFLLDNIYVDSSTIHKINLQRASYDVCHTISGP